MEYSHNIWVKWNTARYFSEQTWLTRLNDALLQAASIYKKYVIF